MYDSNLKYKWDNENVRAYEREMAIKEKEIAVKQAVEQAVKQAVEKEQKATEKAVEKTIENEQKKARKKMESVAIELKKEGLSFEFISKTTGLSIEEIEKL
jgi:hypothetical protein